MPQPCHQPRTRPPTPAAPAQLASENQKVGESPTGPGKGNGTFLFLCSHWKVTVKRLSKNPKQPEPKNNEAVLKIDGFCFGGLFHSYNTIHDFKGW